MKLLLDTHVFLWYIIGDPRLAPTTVTAVSDTTNEVFLSTVSLWEIVVKQELGKLLLPGAASDYIPRQRARHGTASLPLDESSIQFLPSLPPIHRDPFDRMIVCQALAHELVLVTDDRAIRSYPVRCLS